MAVFDTKPPLSAHTEAEKEWRRVVRSGWRKAIAEQKAAGATNSVVRGLQTALIADLNAQLESFGKAPYRKTKFPVVPNADAVQAAWTAYHPTWLGHEVARIRNECQPKLRQHPASTRSLLASLTDRQRRTYEAYRKLKTRKPRGTGARSRGPSRTALAVEQWEAAYPTQSSMLRAIIVGSEPMQFVARQHAMTTGAMSEAFRLAMAQMQDAIDASKLSPKGPRLLPRIPCEGVRLSRTAIDTSKVQSIKEAKH